MDSTMSTSTLPPTILKRSLGDSELSYYLPSREDGVSDMYLRLSIKVQQSNFSKQRLILAWSILQLRHPLLAAKVVSNYDTFNPLKGDELKAEFHYFSPQTSGESLARTYNHVDIIQTPVSHLLSSYLDGPRVLSDDLVCKLILCERLPGDLPTPSLDQDRELDLTALHNADWNSIEEIKDEEKIHGDLILFCCHFIGDAGSIQFITKELVYLLSFPTVHLHEVLARDIRIMNESIAQCNGDERKLSLLLPQSMEARLPPITGKFKSTLSRLEFMRWQSKMVGGQTLPKNPIREYPTADNSRNPERPTKTVTYELMLSKERTKAVLAHSKREGVTISTALFAIVNFAWAELNQGKNVECPTLLYSARNMRPFLPPKKNKAEWKGHESFYYLSLSYFNVILPTFLPSSPSPSRLTPPSTPPSNEDDSSPPSPTVLTSSLTSSSSSSSSLEDQKKKLFWHRARSAKHQARPPNPENMMSLILFISRTFQMSKARKDGSLKFAIMKKVADAQRKKAMEEQQQEQQEQEVKVTRPTMSSLPSAFRVGFELPPSPAPSGGQKFLAPPTPSTPSSAPTPPRPQESQPPKTQQRPSTAALLGLSLLGNFDPLFPPPNCSTSHLKDPSPPFDPVSLGAGCRLKPGGSLLYAYTFDAQLTIVLGYDAGRMGLDEETMKKFWEGIERALEVYID